MKTGPRGCPETSLKKYHYSLCNTPRRAQISSTLDRVHTMKGYKENKGIALLILSLDTRWRRVVYMVNRPLYHPGRTKVNVR